MVMLTALLSCCVVVGQTPPAATADEVPFEIDGSTMVVPATIKGHQLRLIFDTGFGGDAVVDDTIEFGKPTGMMTLRDFVGNLEVPYYTVKDISLGNKKINSTEFQVVAQPGASQFGEYTHVDGLMGFSIIKDFISEINFEHTKFVFHPSTEDLSTRVPDNKKTFLLHMLPIGIRAIVLPVTTADNKRLTMALDTGNAFFATTHKDVLERVGLWPQGQDAKYVIESGVASGEVDSWYKDLKNMTIFGVPVPDSTWDVIDRPAGDTSSDGTIGFGFLKNFNITFDFKRRLVWLENFNGKVANDPEGDVGISAYYSKELKSVVVTRVEPESPADKAGIKKGDTIVDIDDNELTNITYRKLRETLLGPVGTKLKISFSHSGIAQRVTLTRAALINP